MKNLIIALFFTLLITQCSPKKKQNEEDQSEFVADKDLPDNALVFYSVDNSVKVYINENLIFDSGVVPSKTDLQLIVDLNDHIVTGEEILRIELYNGYEPYEFQSDLYWDVSYDLFLNGEISDFLSEKSSNGKIGKVFESEYKIEEWR